MSTCLARDYTFHFTHRRYVTRSAGLAKFIANVAKLETGLEAENVSEERDAGMAVEL